VTVRIYQFLLIQNDLSQDKFGTWTTSQGNSWYYKWCLMYPHVKNGTKPNAGCNWHEFQYFHMISIYFPARCCLIYTVNSIICFICWYNIMLILYIGRVALLHGPEGVQVSHVISKAFKWIWVSSRELKWGQVSAIEFKLVQVGPSGPNPPAPILLSNFSWLCRYVYIYIYISWILTPII